MNSIEVIELAATIRAQLEASKSVRRRVFEDGRIQLDRLLPFLVLYRRPTQGPDPGTEDLATSSAAYLIVSDDHRDHRAVLDLVDALRVISMDHFGAFLLIEIWARPPGQTPVTPTEEATPGPGFRLFGGPDGAACDGVLQLLAAHLAKVKCSGRTARIDAPVDEAPSRPLLYQREVPDLLQVGIEVEPSTYQNAAGTDVFPGVVRALRHGVDRAVRHAVFDFARRETKYRPKNFHSLGRRAMAKAVWEVDEQLDRISSSFDFLLSVTPVNAGALWAEFRRSGYEKMSAMRYRPLPLDPSSAKRDLFSVAIERIEDPTMVVLFREKQGELDRQLTMLMDRGTERFLLGGLQLYGRITPPLVRSAEELLERVPATTPTRSAGKPMEPAELVALAEAEIAFYRGQWEGMDARVETRPNVLAGVMVSRGRLLVASDSRTPRNRVDALIQHEVGTHLVTYYNGKAQRLAQLKSGLAGYEELQEGLAVLAEYLVSGMTPARLRILAARVLSAKALIDGATFVDTFRLLCRYGFQETSAFQITLRIYRGGGFIKDCVYLRGLTKLLEYLAQGEPFERLFIGKIALEHLNIISELETRGAILPPKLLPRYLQRPECQRRLEGLRKGKKLHQLLQDDSRKESRP